MLSRLGFALGTSRAPQDEAGSPGQPGHRQRSLRGRAVRTGNSRTRRRSRAGRGSCRASIGPGPVAPRSAWAPGGGSGPFPRARHGAVRAARRGPPRLPRPREASGAGRAPRLGRGRSGAGAGRGAAPGAEPASLPWPGRTLRGPSRTHLRVGRHRSAVTPEPVAASGAGPAPRRWALPCPGNPSPAAERNRTDGRRLHRPEPLRARPGLGPAGESCAAGPTTTAPLQHPGPWHNRSPAPARERPLPWSAAPLGLHLSQTPADTETTPSMQAHMKV